MATPLRPAAMRSRGSEELAQSFLGSNPARGPHRPQDEDETPSARGLLRCKSSSRSFTLCASPARCRDHGHRPRTRQAPEQFICATSDSGSHEMSPRAPPEGGKTKPEATGVRVPHRANTLCGTPTSCVRVPGFDSHASSQLQLPADAPLERQQVWETQTEFRAPDVRLAQPQLPQAFGEGISRWRSSACPSASHSQKSRI